MNLAGHRVAGPRNELKSSENGFRRRNCSICFVPTMSSVSDREDLYRKWLDWVTTNLGRDARLGEIAAVAATDAAVLGLGFNAAREAARTAWANALIIDSQRQAVPSPGGHLGRNLALGVGLGCLLLIVAVVGVAMWLAASMAGCYAVMC